jgi:hypothetical protein
MSQLTIDDLIEQAVSKVIEERPQLGPFASRLRNGFSARLLREAVDPEKLAALDELDLQRVRQRDMRAFGVEADQMERELDRRALSWVLTADEGAPYPEAVRILFILDDLDAEDVEPACKAFQERVAFHRMMRGEAEP